MMTVCIKISKAPARCAITQGLLVRLALSMRSSAKLRPQVGQAVRSSRGLEANRDLRFGAVEDAGGCNKNSKSDQHCIKRGFHDECSFLELQLLGPEILLPTGCVKLGN